MINRLIRPRRIVFASLLACAAAAAFAIPALADQGGSGLQPWVPQADSPNGYRIFQLYELISIPAILIFLLVEGLLLAIVLRFRRSQRPPGFTPPQWHGSNKLELIWTVIPLLIILGIATVSFLELRNDFNPDTFATKAAASDQINVTITGYRYGWDFDYDNGVKVSSVGRTPTALVVPVGKLVRIRTESRDVIHSWWVPYLMGKTDAVPGYSNYTWIEPQKTGEYRGECAELCGPGHADMLILVKVVPQAEYDAWVRQQKATPAPSPKPSAAPSPSPSPSAASGARTQISGSQSPSPSPTK